MREHTPIVLTVAGSDSGGGAGIQADIKAISATGSYACSVITALTAQNTLGVTGIFTVPAAFIRQQLDAVFCDLDVQAVKIGMLGDSKTIECIAKAMHDYRPKHIVLDPVMVATSGDLLLPKEAIDSLKSLLIPMASIITPNVPEAIALMDHHQNNLPNTEQGLVHLATELTALSTAAVLVKGGHQKTSNSIDIFVHENQLERLSAPRTDTRNTHGTGCSLSSAIASYLAQGDGLFDAVKKAKTYISHAIAAADRLDIGRGHGPVHHFFALDTP